MTRCMLMRLQSLDELFSVPLLGVPAALPRAYWVPDQPTYSSHFMLLQPSSQLLEEKLLPLVHANTKDTFDMDIINTVLGPSCMVLPHHPWAMLSGEFFRTDEQHRKYLGLSPEEEVVWDSEKELKLAKNVHFSDWPVPKPWVMTSKMWVEQEAPVCKDVRGPRNSTTVVSSDCGDRTAWLWLRQEFGKRRKVSYL